MTCTIEPKCRNARTFTLHAEHAPNPSTGRCGRCGSPSTSYDSYADWYDRQQSSDPSYLGQTVSLLNAQLWTVGGIQDVVDLGCGTGLVSGALVSKGWEITGVDASAAMLELAKSRLSGVMHAPVTTTGLASASARTVISTWTHTDVPWAEMVAEAYRLLKRYGQFVYVGGDPTLMPPPSEGGVRSKVGWRQLSEEELLAPFHSRKWELAHVQTVVVADALPMIGIRAVKR